MTEPHTRPEKIRRSWHTWQLVAVGVVALLLGIGIGGASTDKKKTVSASADSTTIPVTTAPPTTRIPTTVATTLITTTTAPAAPIDIVTFAGSSDKTTEAFNVRTGWHLKWTIRGGAGVGITLYDAGGTKLDYISADPGQDESVIRRNCTGCYLKLSPFGSSYTIIINGVPA